MSKLDKDTVLADFTAAFEAANGKTPEIEAKGGWYSVDGGKNLRLAAIADMTVELAGGDTPAAAEPAVAPAPAKKAAPKATPKTKAKAQSAPAKTSNGPTVVSVGDGLKPQAFWQQQNS
ncbi:MAG: hypothetical protein ACI8WB_005535 [Phenylobacterium sp.]|jgi:hypothetical protein